MHSPEVAPAKNRIEGEHTTCFDNGRRVKCNHYPTGSGAPVDDPAHHAPFDNFRELPALCDAAQRVLNVGGRYTVKGTHQRGVKRVATEAGFGAKLGKHDGPMQAPPPLLLRGRGRVRL